MILPPRADMIRMFEYELWTGDEPERARRMYEDYKFLAKLTRRRRSVMRDQLLAYLKANPETGQDGGPLEGLYVKRQKIRRPRDIKRVAEAILEAVGGDLSQLYASLGSGGLSYGKVRQIIGRDAANNLYETAWTEPRLHKRPTRKGVK